ncbi:MAG: DNA replication/repair protein RecF [Ignavibacteria bacterium]|nr:DNA replication/repair protein RecF [Ignavibacteria bacterium]
MIIDQLHLVNFKNYRESSFSFSPDLNFIYGENGNGKTNILEAISILCYTKSFLMNSESDCLKYGEEAFEIQGIFKNRVESKNKVSLVYKKENNERQLLSDGEKVSKTNEYIGRFPLVVLSPYDLKLTMGLQQERRRNFDLLISQVSKVYLNDLRKYQKIIKQKNSLLKENTISKRYSYNELKELIGIWNYELLDLAVKIMLRRLDFTEEFRSYMNSSFSRISGLRYIPVIIYQSDLLDLNGINGFDDLKNLLQKILDEKLDTEIKRGASLVGPHRDSYVFCMDKNGENFEMRSFASQGEHKSFVVSLKLSEFDYINENLKHTNTGKPILLLDDVFSELDKNRIKRISEFINEFNQVFITSTDKEHLKILKNDLRDTKSFHIMNGSSEMIA